MNWRLVNVVGGARGWAIIIMDPRCGQGEEKRAGDGYYDDFKGIGSYAV